MKFSVINFAYFTSFVAGVHSQNIEPQHSPCTIAFRYVERYIDYFHYAVNEYPDVNTRSVKNFVDNAHELVEAFKGSKIVQDLIFKYGHVCTALIVARPKILKGTLCETTRKQLTDIKTNGHALIDSFISKAHPEMLKRIIGDFPGAFKQDLDRCQEQFNKKSCEMGCREDECTEICTKDCKESCKNCTKNCGDCEEDCVYDCVRQYRL
ncbi:hypothetical protein VF21_06248 [Pseudogymnoascus sp. 05NY08]|nr:hypothetical protein VF21_06248 [Pseudogymnoascus sp. 05NY08]